LAGADLELAVGGRPLRFPAVWLRDNCPCAGCVAPGTGQKLTDITDMPNDLAITLTEDDKDLWLAAHRQPVSRPGADRPAAALPAQCRRRR
jgi:hypothetical protein